MSDVCVDIHTHFLSLHSQTIELLQLSGDECFSEDKPRFFSCGIHPWESAEKDVVKRCADIESIASAQACMCVGECGIDRACSVPVDIQMRVCEWQMHIAQTYSKPLIIHCVRAYSDILHLLKKNTITVPVIFHDFNGNETQVTQLLAYNSYFSFGESLFRRSSQKFKLQYVPHECLFLETDDSLLHIEDVYQFVASHFALPLADLQKIIYDNFKRCM
ncbi:MAG: TatD family hydrolase [Bacteroidales bacterium]